jgi:uncharacterized membrane protein
MSTSTALFLLIRAAHVLVAAIWLGATFLLSFVVLPSLQDIGPAAAPMMGALMRRKLPAFMASMGGTAVLTGIYLFYRFTGGFDPALSGTRAAMTFGTGGLAGILALVVGGVVVAKNAKKMGELAARLSSAAEADRAALGAQMAAARARAATGSRIVITLQTVAIVLMAIGHYV